MEKRGKGEVILESIRIPFDWKIISLKSPFAVFVSTVTVFQVGNKKSSTLFVSATQVTKIRANQMSLLAVFLIYLSECVNIYIMKLSKSLASHRYFPYFFLDFRIFRQFMSRRHKRMYGQVRICIDYYIIYPSSCP